MTADRKAREAEQRQKVWDHVGGPWHGKCEDCGKKPDWRGLHIAHTPNKGMGGTKRLYVARFANPEAPFTIRAVCARCHAETDHHLRESYGQA
jgi:hypothetical protein